MDKENYYPIEFDENGDSFVIVNNGTAPAPCVITIIPRIDLITLTISGLTEIPIEVKNIYTNDVLVIDGENNQILVNDVIAFEKYNAWEFPKLQPGENNIQVSNGAQISIQIEYNPRYI